MKKVFAIIAIIMMAIANTACAEVRTYTATGSYTMSPKETLENGIKHAREDAMRLISESVGVYIESQTETKNQQLTQDQIKTISSNIIRVTDESVPTIVQHGSGLSIKLTITATADDSEIFTSQILKNEKTENDLLDSQKKLLKEKTSTEALALFLYDATQASLKNGADGIAIAEKIEQYENEVSEKGKPFIYLSLADCYGVAGFYEKSIQFMEKAIKAFYEEREYKEAVIFASSTISPYTIEEWQRIKALAKENMEAYMQDPVYNDDERQYFKECIYAPEALIVDYMIKNIKKKGVTRLSLQQIFGWAI